MKKFLPIALLLISVSLFSMAQQRPYGITGKVNDAQSGNPVDYATITVYSLPGNKVVSGAVCNAKGLFTVQDLVAGSYKLSVSFIGYRSFFTDTLKLRAGKYMLLLPVIRLVNSSKSLNEVIVTGKTPVVENKIDRVVYNAANDVTAQGGVALDVLKKVPQVTVDINGNVELQGNPDIRFLINGKPSSIFGNSLTDALSSIPASQIKSIEAITSPGAKYDAQGTGGIINIILKDSKAQGYNGSVSLSGGTRLENAAVNLNYRQGSFGLNAFFGGNAQLNSKTPNSQNRTSFDTSGKTSGKLLQNGITDFKRNGYRTGIGFDWNLSKTNVLSASLSYNHFSSQGNSQVNQEAINGFNNPTVTGVYSVRNAVSQSHTNAVDWSLDYKKQFRRPGEQIELLYSSSYGSPYSYYSQSQVVAGQSLLSSGSFSNDPGIDHLTEISADYILPLTKDVIFSSGLKTTIQHITSNATVQSLGVTGQAYEPDPSQSSDFSYRLNVYAAYAQLAFPLFKYLNVQSGIRYESTTINLNSPNPAIPSYGNFVPSIIFSHDLKNNASIKLAYSHRLSRPDYRELNPFQNLSDPYNITAGNPFLKPEIGDNFELGYSKNFKNGAMLYVAFGARDNSQNINTYTTFQPSYRVGDSVYSNVSVAKPQNIGTIYNIGSIIAAGVPLAKFIVVRVNVMLFDRIIANRFVPGNNINGFNYRFNINYDMMLPKGLVFEAFGTYNSSSQGVQGKQPQVITYTFALRKQIWKKQASIGLTATDPFNKYINQYSSITTANYVAENTRLVPYQSFGINLTYKFGKLQFKKNKETENYLDNPPSM